MTQRRRSTPWAVACVLMAVLVATAIPVQAADPALEVASEHTTDSDFSGASLTNMSISGTGTSAVVAMDHDNLAASNDTFDDGAHTGWTEIQNSWSESGGELFVQSSANGDWIIEKDSPTHSTDNLNATVQFGLDNTFSGQQGSFYPVWQDANNYVRVLVDRDSGEYDLRVVSGGTTVASIDSTWGVDTNNHTIRVVNNSGTWELYLDGALQGTAAATTSISGKSRLRFQHSGVTDPKGWNFDYFDVESGSAPQTAQYVSANHTASEILDGRVDLSLTDASATITWQGWDGSSWVNVNSTTTSSSGVQTLDLSSGGYSKWRVVVDFSRSSDTFTAELEDEAVLFNAATPSVDNTSASPDNTNVTSETVTLSIDVSDADFATSQGDSLTVEWYLDGSKVNTTSGVTSNGTVSVTEQTPGGGGDHTWHVVVTDSYGDQTTSSTFSFGTPSTLFIYNESNVSQLVDNATVDLTFYFENGTGPEFSVTRSTSDGTLNMTGLPTDQPFVVAAEANGYLSRRIYIENLFQTQEIYLLPDTKQHVDRVYSLADYTGLFPPEVTVLKIQRSLNGSWKTVEADFFGATGEFTAQLRYNTRHRLVILNTQTGASREVGYTTPLSDGSATIEVTAEGVQLVGVGVTVKFSPGINALPSADDTNVSVTVDSTSSTLNWWKMTVTHHNNTSSTQLFSVNSSSPGTQTATLDLANKTGNVTVLVEWSTAGGSGSVTETFRLRGLFTNQYSLLDTVLGFAGLIPDVHVENFKVGLAILVTALVTTASAGVLRISTEAVGGVALLSLAGFAVIGFLPYDVVFASGVALVAFAGLGRKL